MERSAFFCKRTKRSHVLLRSLQKNKTFSAFFYVLCKRMLRSLDYFTFLRKERKRTHRPFGSHKRPKTRKKNVLFLKRMQKNDAFRTVKNAVPNPDWVFIFKKNTMYCYVKTFFLSLPFPLSMMTTSEDWQALLMHKLFEQSFGPVQTREQQ